MFVGAALIAIIVIGLMLAKLSATIDPEALFGKEGEANTAVQAGVPRVSAVDHARGAVQPSVTWIEYGDFDCPFCKRYHEELKQLLVEYPEEVQVIFRHFPLEIHPEAYGKSVISECVSSIAGEEVFWQLHDTLFEQSGADAVEVAVSLGVNEQTLSSCVSSGAFDSRIDTDITTGVSAGITGTPTTMIVAPDGNGSLVPGVISFEQMQEIMNYLLNEYEGA